MGNSHNRLFNNCMNSIITAINSDSNSEKQIITYKFRHGTTVHAPNLNEAKNIMKYTIRRFDKTRGQYWANELHDEVWHVQYSTADIPLLYSIIRATSGNAAAYIGYANLHLDMKEMDLIELCQ